MPEKRAMFQKTEISEDGNVYPCYSVSLSRLQVIVTVLVGVITITASLVSGVTWLEKVVAKVSKETYSQSLREYHTEMRPKLMQLVDDKISASIASHELQFEANTGARIDQLSDRVTALETQNVTLIEQGRHNRDLLEEILRRLR